MKCLIAKYEEKVGNKLILDGLVRVNEKKPEFGGMMLEAPDQVVLSPSGFLNRRRKV